MFRIVSKPLALIFLSSLFVSSASAVTPGLSAATLRHAVSGADAKTNENWRASVLNPENWHRRKPWQTPVSTLVGPGTSYSDSGIVRWGKHWWFSTAVRSAQSGPTRQTSMNGTDRDGTWRGRYDRPTSLASSMCLPPQISHTRVRLIGCWP